MSSRVPRARKLSGEGLKTGWKNTFSFPKSPVFTPQSSDQILFQERPSVFVFLLGLLEKYAGAELLLWSHCFGKSKTL